jgi:hypothetical protein
MLTFRINNHWQCKEMLKIKEMCTVQRKATDFKIMGESDDTAYMKRRRKKKERDQKNNCKAGKK